MNQTAVEGVSFNLSLGLIFLLALVFGFGYAGAGIFFRDRRARALLALAMAAGTFVIFVGGIALGVAESLMFTGLALLALCGLAVGRVLTDHSPAESHRPQARQRQEPKSLPGGQENVPQAGSHLCPECGSVLEDDTPEGLCPGCLLHSGLGSAFPSPPESDAHTVKYHGAFVPPAPAELARFFPQMEILALLGQGGMGAVYKARQLKLDRLVALKVLPPEWGKDPAFAERFMREARALARLSHPHVVAIHDFGEAEGLYYFVMEYVDGANLRQILQDGRLPPDEALRVVPQLCEALEYAHEEGVVHRDIKPENILLDRKGRVKVADFGLAKLVGPTPGHFTLTGSRQVVGTPHYMAPEQMEKPHTVDHRADIYSLGVVLYEMLTGELPLGRFALPSQKAAVDGRLDDVVLRALAKEPAERYQRASEVKTNLEAVAGKRSPAEAAPAVTTATCISFPFTTRIPASNLQGVAADRAVTGTVRWPGRLRFDGHTLVLEFEGGASAAHLRERAIPIREIQSIELKREWLSTVLVLQAERLSTLADVPGSRLGQLKLYIDREHREAAERLYTWGPERSWRVADLEKVRRQVSGPAMGLMISGVCTLAIWLVAIVVYFESYHDPVSSRLALLLALLVFAVTGTILVGAVRMSRLEAYGLCKVASVLAMLPWSCAFIISLPAGWLAYETLRKSKVRLAFLFNRGHTPAVRPQIRRPRGFLHRKMHSLARAARFWVVDSTAAEPPSAVRPSAASEPATTPAQARPPRRRPWWVAGVVVALAGPVALWFLAGSWDSFKNPASTSTSASLSPLGVGGQDREEPILTAEIAKIMNLNPFQVESANRIRQDALREYAALEGKHTQRQVVREGQLVKATIGTFPDELAELEHRVWKELDQVLDIPQQYQARGWLPFSGGLFPFGKEVVAIEIARMGNWFHWDFAGSGPPVNGRGPSLPAKYQRLWDGPSAQPVDSGQ